MINVFKLALSSLWFYRRTNVWVWLGIAVGTAVFTGAMIIGDSINDTLRHQGLDRIGETTHIITAGERLFTPQLADRLQNESNMEVAPVLLLPGIVSYHGNRLNQVQLVGIDNRFNDFWPEGTSQVNLSLLDENDSVCINQHLANRMKLSPGDEFVLKIRKPLVLPGNIPLANRDNLYVSKRVKVEGVIGDLDGGRFALNPQQVARNSIFLPHQMLEGLLGQENLANLLLIKKQCDVELLMKQLQQSWALEDIQLEIGSIHQGDELELRSKRFFIDSVISNAFETSEIQHTGLLTYLVNSLHTGKSSTPYSFVSGISSAVELESIDSEEININEWLSKDLGADIGDTLTLTYYSIGPEGELIEELHEFRVGQIVPMGDWAKKKDLMPSIPGLSDNENCSEWDPGFPVDLSRIRDKDEAYWNEFGGSPKAFISIKTARELWGNQYGNYTALRFPCNQITREELSAFIRANVSITSLGFHVVEIRNEALNAANQALDFRQLFVGLSFVVIAGALLLTGMIFRAGVFQRGGEIATLRCLGFSKTQLYLYFFLENVPLVLSASAFGAFMGVIYNFMLVWALGTIWVGVVGATNLYVSIKAQTLFVGIIVGVLLSFAVLLPGMLRFTRDKKGLVLGISEKTRCWNSSFVRWSVFSFSVCLLIGVLSFVSLHYSTMEENISTTFFSLGFILLIALLGLVAFGLFSSGFDKSQWRLPKRKDIILTQLRRDPWHSLFVTALIALSLFSVIGVGANRSELHQNSSSKSSGSGGFELYAETTFPLRHNLNDPSIRYQYGLDSKILDGVVFYPIIRYGGDDASCFNLNRVPRPSLLGVNSNNFGERGAFRFLGNKSDRFDAANWSLLNEFLREGEIPAVMDYNVMVWGLGKKIGDTLEYRDEQGRPLIIRLVGSIDSSIFQGSILISEENMKKYFPMESAAQVLLVDLPRENDVIDIMDSLNQALQDYGIEIQTTQERLNSFMVVENTYLSIFLLQGGLGMIIGLFGFGVVVFRDILSRRSEFALLRSLGFPFARIQAMSFNENIVLLLVGMFVGVVTALLAVFPSLFASEKTIPWFTLLILILSVLFTGVMSLLIAIRIGLKGSLIKALRKE